MDTGTRIYYTGDMANEGGAGVVTAQRGPNHFDVTMDDGRKFNALFSAQFSAHPGRRFWLEAEYIAEHRRRADEFNAEMRAQKAAKPVDKITQRLQMLHEGGATPVEAARLLLTNAQRTGKD